jgi:hypothetical protein
MGKAKFGTALMIATLAITVPLASAAGTTTVTIKEKSGDFSGKVTGNPSSCRADRLVKVKRVAPGKDPTIASDTSESNGTWSTGNNSADPGDYYAKVKKTIDCGKAKSSIVTVN